MLFAFVCVCVCVFYSVLYLSSNHYLIMYGNNIIEIRVHVYTYNQYIKACCITYI